MLVDTHCHLTFGDLAPQVDAVLGRAREAGVERVINVATSIAEARAGIALLNQYDDVFLVAGIHPHEAGKCTDDDLSTLRDLHSGKWGEFQNTERLVGVGETGLDFHYDFATPAQQEAVFRTHLEIAQDCGRPVVLHARKAELQVCDVLADYPALAGRFVFHCYSEAVEVARRILDMGGYVSFTGVVTFKNAEVIRDSARFVPEDRFMVETDAPYLSPVPVRKIFPNEPAFVAHTAKYIAELRGVTLEQLAEQTTRNARRFYGLPERDT